MKQEEINFSEKSFTIKMNCGLFRVQSTITHIFVSDFKQISAISEFPAKIRINGWKYQNHQTPDASGGPLPSTGFSSGIPDFWQHCQARGYSAIDRAVGPAYTNMGLMNDRSGRELH
jgi:hypothetical protein